MREFSHRVKPSSSVTAELKQVVLVAVDVFPEVGGLSADLRAAVRTSGRAAASGSHPPTAKRAE